MTGYLRNKPKNEFYLVVLGDIKGGRVNDSFTAQEKGKLAGFLNRYIKYCYIYANLAEVTF